MTGAECVGLTVALCLGRLIENKKIEKGMGRLHCGGRLLIGGRNNQIKVGVDVFEGDVGEETRPGRNVWGGCCLFLLGVELKGNKKTKILNAMALKWPPDDKITQQSTKNTGAQPSMYCVLRRRFGQ